MTEQPRFLAIGVYPQMLEPAVAGNLAALMGVVTSSSLVIVVNVAADPLDPVAPPKPCTVLVCMVQAATITEAEGVLRTANQAVAAEAGRPPVFHLSITEIRRGSES